jgi:putative tricarboxylic transport membrane protein
MNRRSDRIIGVLLLLFAVWYGYTALKLRMTLLTDPIGPKFFPLFLATLIGLLSFYLIFKPDKRRGVGSTATFRYPEGM